MKKLPTTIRQIPREEHDYLPVFDTFIPLQTTRTISASKRTPPAKPAQPKLRPCGCGGKVGSRAAVKLHPRLNLLDGLVRYDVRCARCHQTATTANKAGFIRWQQAIRVWNNLVGAQNIARWREATRTRGSNE